MKRAFLSIATLTLAYATGVDDRYPHFSASLANTSSADQVEAIKDLTQRWVEVENIRSEEGNEGKTHLSQLQQLQEVLQGQLQHWRAKVSEMEGSMSRADKERQEWLQKKQSMDQNREQALAVLKKLERELKNMEPLLPAPLIKELELPLRQLKALNLESQWLNRYQACFSILRGVSSFHRRYTTATQDIHLQGKTYSVKVLYVGLSQAYFMNFDGSLAGVGRPKGHAWTWTTNPKLQASIKTAMDMAENTSTQLKLVNLPVEVN
jgi:hypothetical protein